MNENILLTATEVAQLLRVSTSFAYRLMRQGNIPTVRLGRSVRVRSSDLESFIANSIIDTFEQDVKK